MKNNNEMLNFIANMSKKKFKVRFSRHVDIDVDIYETDDIKEMTYLELGIYLLTHKIELIEIILDVDK